MAHQILILKPRTLLASYPGLFTTVFVTCSTNAATASDKLQGERPGYEANSTLAFTGGKLASCFLHLSV